MTIIHLDSKRSPTITLAAVLAGRLSIDHVVGDADQNVLCFDQKIKSFDDFVYLGVIMVVVMIKLPFLHQLQTAVVIKMSHHDCHVL